MIINKELNNEGEVFEQLERGIVKREVDYKYMGIKVNESGNLQDHLNSMENKIKSAISQVFSLGSPYQVGEEFVTCRIELFTKCIMLVNLWYLCVEHLTKGNKFFGYISS